MEFRLLGPLEVTEGERPIPLGGPKQRAVLAHLLLQANQVVPTGLLIEEIWGEEPPAAARGSLQAYVSRLRKLLGPDRIEGRSRGYVLHAVSDEVDVLRFQELTRQGQRSLAADPRAAADSLGQALELWRGPPFADVGDSLSLEAEATRLEELRLSAMEDRIAAELAVGNHAAVIGELETLTERHPLRERLWGQLMLALYRSGRQAEALSTYGRARDVLAEELGIDPSPQVQRLQTQILNQDPELDLLGQPLRGYRLLERIGEGTFGVVHRAIQPQVGREVAVKVIHPHLANQAEFIRRFEAEAQLVARLEHPHIVPLYDYWREPSGAYLVMRWLRGGSLQSALADGPLEQAKAARVVEQVAAALAAAHREGVVHRDVKPSNILLDEEGNAYLSDFGIAEELLAGEAAESARLFPYRSPEQRRGQPSTPRSDLYGLGAVLLEMLTGRPPAGPDKPRRRRKVQAGLPAAVARVIARALSDDPDDRFAEATELADAVVRAIGAAPAAARRAVLPAEAANPYKGLRPFFEADASDFFGREEFVERLLARMAEKGPGSRFLAVVGPSGSGKSSVVRAGLVPALRGGALRGSGRWFVVEMLPGADPLEELEAALMHVAVGSSTGLLEELGRDDQGLLRAVARVLPRDRSELVLVVDQFEELFTLVADEDRRARFLSLLLAAVSAPRSRVRVVITLRADFYDRPLQYRGFAELMRTRTETLIPMSAEELERAISGPAMRVGVIPEPGLTARMVADVADQPGGLPLLQYALTELFGRRKDSSLTMGIYEAIGGVTGALGRRADELYGGFREEGREACRQVFLRLVTLGEGTEDTRRLVRRSELSSLNVDQPALDEVISSFGAHRLLSFARDSETREPTVEVAHEALLREWPRLARWIDEGRDDLRSERRLAQATGDWEEAGRDRSFLLQGTRLEQAQTWTAAAQVAITSLEREYLQASLAERDARRAEEEARRAHERALERRSVSRLRTLVAALAVAALVAGTLSAFALGQRARAQREARIATARELAAAARVNLEVDPDLSINLALEAVATTRGPDGIVLREAEEALHEAVQASRVVFRLPGIEGVAWSGDGRLLATAPRDGVTIWDASTGEPVRRLPISGTATLAFSPDGRFLAIGGLGPEATVWRVATGERAVSLPSDSGTVWAVAFSPDGDLVAGMTLGGRVIMWEVSTGTDVGEVSTGRELAEVPSGGGVGFAFSPDGKLLAVPVGPGTALYEVPSGERRGGLSGDGRNVAFSPDGSRIATTGLSGVASIWDARTSRQLFPLEGHEGHVSAVVWSPDGRIVATGGDDGTARLWDASSGDEMLVIPGQQAKIGSLAFSPDGSRLSSGSSNGSMVWDITPAGNREVMNIPAHSGLIPNVTYSPGGARIASAGTDGRASVWDAETGQKEFDLSTHEAGVTDVVLSRDGELIATSSFDGTAKLWDASGKELRTFQGHTSAVWAVSFSPGGDLLATVSEDQTGRVWEVATGREIAVFRGHTDFVYDAAFSPDGSMVASVSNDYTARLWDPSTGDEIRALEGHDENIVEQAWSPDGTRLATASFDGTAKVWDASSGRDVLTLRGHAAIVLDVEASPDGTRWATASPDGTVRIWDATTGRESLTLRLPTGAGRLAFSPDGTRLAATDGMVRVLTLELDELIRLAAERVSRPLTLAECRQYLHLSVCPESV
jgi:WD40 repeat protein/DNA-binding SARP family transcriptional activator